jgi:hypothetical protein
MYKHSASITLKSSSLPQDLPAAGFNENSNGLVGPNRRTMIFKNINLNDILSKVLNKNREVLCRVSWYSSGATTLSTFSPYYICISNFSAPKFYDAFTIPVQVALYGNNTGTCIDGTNKAVVGSYNIPTLDNRYPTGNVTPKDSGYVVVKVPNDDYIQIDMLFQLTMSIESTGASAKPTIPNIAINLEFVPLL